MIGQFKTPAFNPRVVKVTAASYTALMTDDEIKVNGAYTITLPAISTMAANSKGGKCFKINNVGSSTVTISCNSADTIEDGSTDGATSVYLYNENDYIVLEADIYTNQWKVKYPSPAFDAGYYIQDSSLPGIKSTLSKQYFTLVDETSGTTAQTTLTAPVALTILDVTATALDANAGDMVVKNGTNTVASFAKSTTAGEVTGEDGSLANTSVAAASTITVESSTTDGNGRIKIFCETAY